MAAHGASSPSTPASASASASASSRVHTSGHTQRSTSPPQRKREEHRRHGRSPGRSPGRNPGRNRRDERRKAARSRSPAGSKAHKPSEDEAVESTAAKPDFGLSGKLAAETNTVNGVVLKYSEPAEARRPKDHWRVYVFKDGKDVELHHVDRASGYLFGRDRRVADIPTDHPSCSSQHAVLQFRQVGAGVIKPYVIDLSSTNGTFLNGDKVPAQRYVELRSKDVIKFGFSTREYVILCE
ncbi:SMAD/FHA domain-containing protein [Martensiomyces pterosporus]|nr:SMAD/FHA domain-containing protein [Martensiomyces pterosporus]